MNDGFAYPPRGLGRLQAARYVGLPPGEFDDAVLVGPMPLPRQIDDLLIWDRQELDAAFEALPEDEVDE